MSHQTPNGPDSDPIEGMDDLSALYAASRDESAISTATEQTILAAAKRELGTGPQQRSPSDKTVRRWSVPFAGAALILLSTTLFMVNRDQLPGPVSAPELSIQPELMSQPPAAIESPSAESLLDRSGDSVRDRDRVSTVKMKTAPKRLDVQQTQVPQAAATMQPQRATEQQQAKRAMKLHPTAKMESEIEPRMGADTQTSQQNRETKIGQGQQASRLQSSRAFSSLSGGAQADDASPGSTPLQADSLDAIAPDSFDSTAPKSSSPDASGEKQDPAEQRLEQIKTQLEHGEHTEALKELKRWRLDYPAHPIPDWAIKLLDQSNQNQNGSMTK